MRPRKEDRRRKNVCGSFSLCDTICTYDGQGAESPEGHRVRIFKGGCERKVEALGAGCKGVERSNGHPHPCDRVSGHGISHYIYIYIYSYTIVYRQHVYFIMFFIQLTNSDLFFPCLDAEIAAVPKGRLRLSSPSSSFALYSRSAFNI